MEVYVCSLGERAAPPRALRTVTSTREGVEHEKYGRPTGTEVSTPGGADGSLLDFGPQRSDRTVRHSAGEAPLLVVVSLAGGDSVDGTALRFLLKQTLALKKEDEEERRKVAPQQLEEKLEAEMKLLNAAGPAPSSSTAAGKRRKRKKRRKRRCGHTGSHVQVVENRFVARGRRVLLLWRRGKST